MATKPGRRAIAHSDDMYAIHRKERFGLPAWGVTVNRRGQFFYRTFWDHRHGGKLPALAEAQRYRDELLRKVPPVSGRELRERVRSHNSTGVSGVCRTTQRGRPVFIVRTQLEPGRAPHKRFAIDELGETRAWELAVAERQRQLAQVEGCSVLYVQSDSAKPVCNGKN